jgi:hypothetical protein
MLLNLLIELFTQEIDESILACPSFHLLAQVKNAIIHGGRAHA